MSKLFILLSKFGKKFLLHFYTTLGRMSFILRGIKCKKVLINGILMLEGIDVNSLTLGQNVKINSRLGANKIGYASPTIFQCLQGKITIGNNVGISNSALVARNADIHIGDNVMIGAGCKFYTSDFHSISYEERILNGDKRIKTGDIMIGEGAFIGAGSTILKGVTIGRHSVIGACSVITKSVPDGEVWAGNPAKFIKNVSHI